MEFRLHLYSNIMFFLVRDFTSNNYFNFYKCFKKVLFTTSLLRFHDSQIKFQELFCIFKISKFLILIFDFYVNKVTLINYFI